MVQMFIAKLEEQEKVSLVVYADILHFGISSFFSNCYYWLSHWRILISKVRADLRLIPNELI